MESLLAIGLAANIVQFVEYACKLITQAKEVHNSASGLPQDAAHMQTVVQDIHKLLGSLDSSSAGNHRPVDPKLTGLAAECKVIADEILLAIKKLSNEHPDSRWSSFKVALKIVLRADQLKRLAERVSQLQSKIIIELSAALQYGDLLS